jgi:hypothetical protein
VSWRPLAGVLVLIALGAGIRAMRLRPDPPAPRPAPEVARGRLEVVNPDGGLFGLAFRPDTRNFSISGPTPNHQGDWRVNVEVDPNARPGTFFVEVTGPGIPHNTFERTFGDYGELYAHQGHVVRYLPTDRSR